MVDDPLTECIVCGGPVRRIVSTVGVVFKGSGFYVTDNRSSSVNGRSSSSKKDAAEKKETTTSTESSTAGTTATQADSPSSG